MSAPVTHRPNPVPSRRVTPLAKRPRDPRLSASPPARGTDCGGSAHPRQPLVGADAARVFARRRAVAGILAGAALGALVWVFAIVGGDYAAASSPDPVTTSVVHVRGGETLNAVAARVAPDVSRQAVMNQLRALNGLTSATLSVGQALVVPVYR